MLTDHRSISIKAGALGALSVRTAWFFLLVLILALAACGGAPQKVKTGQIAAAEPPSEFPSRIWAACDFEQLRNDAVWLGQFETVNIPRYPGNHTALKARPAGETGLLFLALKPVSYPRMSEENKVFFRYYQKGVGSLNIQLFNLDKNLWHPVQVTGLVEGRWSVAMVDLNQVPTETQLLSGRIAEGERLNDLVIFAEPAKENSNCELIVDDLICFSDNQSSAQELPGPFPKRVICIWDFDVVDNYHPWTHENYRVLRKGQYLENDWGVAQALPYGQDQHQRIRLIIDPPQEVGENTRARFRYLIKGARSFQIQIFDLTDRDNRHIVLDNCAEGIWQWADVNFTADGIRNDGNQTPFSAGHVVDDLFFHVFQKGVGVELLIDEVVLYDAGPDSG